MKLFYSYSHKDVDYRNELEKHLSVLRSNGLVESWYDKKNSSRTKLSKRNRSKLKRLRHDCFFL